MTGKLTVEDIASAERLAGVNYTAQEREQMVNNLEGQLLSALARRDVALNNATPMANHFDPRLPGFAMPHGASEVRASVQSVKLPEDDADIAFAPLTALAHWIASGQLTSRRLTEIYLARIDAFNPQLECYATVTHDQALAEADAIGQPRPRRGQPRPFARHFLRAQGPL